MSEAKFEVGQWVVSQYRIGVYRVAKIDTDGTLQVEGSDAWHPEASWEPFVWQVGKTYKTTLDGVTATVDEVKENGDILATSSQRASLRYWDSKTGLLRHCETDSSKPHLLPYLADEPPPESDAAGIGHDIKTLIFESLGEASMCWSETPRGVFDSDKAVEVGERLVKALRSKLFPLPTIPIADEDAATFSEFEDADECDDVNHPTHYTQHPSGVECVDIAEAFNFNIGNAIKYLWRAGLKGDAVEDLRKAAWYVQREIERAKR